MARLHSKTITSCLLSECGDLTICTFADSQIHIDFFTLHIFLLHVYVCLMLFAIVPWPHHNMLRVLLPADPTALYTRP